MRTDHAEDSLPPQPSEAFSRQPGELRNVLLLGMVLVAVTLCVYWQVGDHGFINLDDNLYVYKNPHVSAGISGANIVWAFTSVEVANWHPLTWLSHMADAQLYGLNPRGHHLTNVVIHAIAAVLLLFLLYRVTGAVWQSGLVAALFALHPLHVESVAWVSERKDVLSALFWFATLLLYAEYAAKRKRIFYLLTLFCFVLGLMVKPMLVTLPLVMLLMDFWPLDRMAQPAGLPLLNRLSLWVPLVKEKIPFFVFSLLSAAITLYAQDKGGTVSYWMPFEFRLENAAIAYVTYIAQMFWPHDLAVFYPLSSTFPVWKFAGSVLFLAVVSAATLWAGRRYPFLALGWFWFLVTLVPVIGLVQVGGQSMADRYTYIPHIGLFIMVAWGVPALTRKLPYRQPIHALLAGAALSGFVAVTWQQIGYWRDDVSLYRHALKVTSNNSFAHINLGAALQEKGDPNAAIEEFQAALAIKPKDHIAHYNLGLVLKKKGDLNAAIEEFKMALAIKPNDCDAHLNLGLAFSDKGDLNAAIEEYQVALAINPNFYDAHINLGVAFSDKGDLDAAIGEYKKAIAINPNYYDEHNNLGVAFAKNGDLDAAIGEYKKAIAINPNYYDAHINLGVAFTEKGDMDEAIKELRAGLTMEPNDALGHSNLGIALGKRGDMDAAIREFRVALAIDPDFESARNYLKFALDQKRMSNNGRE